MIANRLRKDAPKADSPGSRTLMFRTADGALVDGAGQVFVPVLVVDAAPDGEAAPTGALFIDTDTPGVYVNIGTYGTPDWEQIAFFSDIPQQ